MDSEGPERDPRALPLRLVASETGGSYARARGRPLGGGQGPTSEWRERAAVPWSPQDSVPKSIYTREQQQEIDRLFEAALLGELPRRRPLTANEPEKLNEQHLGIISMRATGLSQRLIAKAYGASDTYIHIILNHPDAVYLLARLISMRAASGNQFQERMEALAEPAMSAIENALLEDDPDEVKIALKKAPLAFRVLEQGGKIKKPSQEVSHQHNHKLDASPAQISALRDVLIESRELRDARFQTAEIVTTATVRSLPNDFGEVDADAQSSTGRAEATSASEDRTEGSAAGAEASAPQAYLVEEEE